VASSSEPSSSSIREEKSSIEPKLDSSRAGSGGFVAAGFAGATADGLAAGTGFGRDGRLRIQGLGRSERFGIEAPSEISGQVEGARIRFARALVSVLVAILVVGDPDLLGELPILFLGLAPSSGRAGHGCRRKISRRRRSAPGLALNRFGDDGLDRLGLTRRRVRQEEGMLAAGAAHPRTRGRNPRVVELEARRTFLAGHNHVAVPARRASARGGSIPPAKSRAHKQFAVRAIRFRRQGA
jgi:hypothetical protein